MSAKTGDDMAAVFWLEEYWEENQKIRKSKMRNQRKIKKSRKSKKFKRNNFVAVLKLIIGSDQTSKQQWAQIGETSKIKQLLWLKLFH